MDNRRLTHRPGRYDEVVQAYLPEKDKPITSVINFSIDSIYANNAPLPQFMGWRINFQGLTQPADFFHPDYDWEPEPEATDYRRTVYWNPDATTDAEGRARIVFYNNGFSRQLNVSAEGITPDGQPITADGLNNQ